MSDLTQSCSGASLFYASAGSGGKKAGFILSKMNKE